MIWLKRWSQGVVMADRRRIETAISASKPMSAPRVMGLFESQSLRQRQRAARLSVASRMARRFAEAQGRGTR